MRATGGTDTATDPGIAWDIPKFKHINESTTFQPPRAKHGSPLTSPVQSFLSNSTINEQLSPINANSTMNDISTPNNLNLNNTTFEDARSDISNLSNGHTPSRRNSLSGSTTPGDGSGMVFISKLHSHYGVFVKMLPILIIFLPSLIKLFFPLGVIKFGEFQIGDDQNHPSAIIVDVFSVLLICWILKFLLDWPWKWYLQISDLELKLKMYLEGVDPGAVSPNNNKTPRLSLSNPSGMGRQQPLKDHKFQDITEKGLSKLQTQHFIALLFCVLSPFLCGGILIFARKHIVLIGSGPNTTITAGTDEGNAVFTDLNIGIFVSCGLIRVIIQISEQIQRSTAAIEARTEKMIQTQSQEYMESEIVNRLTNLETAEPAITLELPSEIKKLQEQITTLKKEFNHMSVRFEVFYTKNKFAIEGDMTFLSSKHFKMLEKEINELNFKLQTKTIELEQLIMQLVRSQSANSSHASSNDSGLSSFKAQGDSEHLKRPNSLHGMPLGKNTPTYAIDPQSGTPLKYPIQNYSSFNSNIPSFAKMKELFPMLENYGYKTTKNTNGVSNTNTNKNSLPESQIDEEALRQLESLHEQGYLKIDLGVIIPILKFLFSLPYLIQKVFWKLISFVPSQVLRGLYYLLLQTLDAMVEIYQKNQREMKLAAASSNINNVANGKIQEIQLDEDESFIEHGQEQAVSLVKSPKKRRYTNL